MPTIVSQTGPLASFCVRIVTAIVSDGDVSPLFSTAAVTAFMSHTTCEQPSPEESSGQSRISSRFRFEKRRRSRVLRSGAQGVTLWAQDRVVSVAGPVYARSGVWELIPFG